MSKLYMKIETQYDRVGKLKIVTKTGEQERKLRQLSENVGLLVARSLELEADNER